MVNRSNGGVPYHAAEQYLAGWSSWANRLRYANKSATRLPAKGPVERKVVRIVTPGTLLTPHCWKKAR